FQLTPLVGCRIVGPGPGVSALRHDVSAAKQQHLLVQCVIAGGPPEQRRLVVSTGRAVGGRQIAPRPRPRIIAESVSARMKVDSLAVGIVGVLVVVIDTAIGGQVGPDVALLVRQGKYFTRETRRRRVSESRAPILFRGIKVFPLTGGPVEGQVVVRMG